MVPSKYAEWLRGPPLTGWLALVVGVLALAIPTVVRAELNGLVTGCEFTPYLPFILLSAVLLRWWQATGVVVAAVAVMGGWLMGTANEHLASACFRSAASVFLAASALTIGTVILVRRVLTVSQSRDVEKRPGDIVFSLKDNAVWASWYGSDQPVCLGSQDKVEYMMADFLAQGDLGRRLSRQHD